MPNISTKFDRGHPLRGRQMQVGGTKSATFDKKPAISRKRHKIDAWFLFTGVDKGGPGPPMAWQKNFLVKIEGLSSLPPAKSGRACHDNPTGRGYFYQMPNMYTCMAYLIEIRKFCSKNLVHKGVNVEAQNALKLTYEHL